MKRDPDLLRSILLYIEEHAPPQGGLQQRITVEGYDKPTIDAHTELLIEDGLVAGQVIDGLNFKEIMVTKLTSAGHDAIEAAKNSDAWHRAKRIATEKGASLTFAMLVELVKAEARRHLGLP
jgi:hypothetical protein